MRNQNTPWVLGISASHNGSACLLRGDKIHVAIQEERLSGQKRARVFGGLSSLSVNYCLKYAGIHADDLSAVVLCSQAPSDKVENDLTLNPLLRVIHNEIPFFRIGHHLGHAISAFA